jgi:hypothetical protein
LGATNSLDPMNRRRVEAVSFIHFLLPLFGGVKGWCCEQSVLT